MISLNDYELYYEEYLAESELYDNLLSIADSSITESTGLISLQEDVKETIKGYLNRIAQAIQKAWDKFKKFFQEKVLDSKLVTNIKDKLPKVELNFTIKNYPQYDINKLGQIKLTEYNYDQMKPFLVSEEAYIKQYFPQLSYDKDKGKIKDVFDAAIIKGTKDTVATVDIVKTALEYITNTHQDLIKDTQNDIDTVNKSFTSIANKISSENPTQAQNNENNQSSNNESYINSIIKDSIVIYESLILEDDAPNNNGQNNDKMGFDDTNVQNANNGGSVSGQGKTNDVKETTNYVRANIDVLTVKMNMIKSIYSNYSAIVYHYAKLAGIDTGKKNKDNENNNQKPQQQQGDIQVQKVDTGDKQNVTVKNQ